VSVVAARSEEHVIYTVEVGVACRGHGAAQVVVRTSAADGVTSRPRAQGGKVYVSR
jgi:hypothetical protein